MQSQDDAATGPAASTGRASGSLEDDNAHIGKSIRAQHAQQELTEEERKLVEQMQAGLMRRLTALDIKLEDCIVRNANSATAPRAA